MAFNIDGRISKQRVYCKIQAQLGFPPTEIHADLQKVYGNGALKYATACKKFMGMVLKNMLQFAVLMMVGSQLKMTLRWAGRFPF